MALLLSSGYAPQLGGGDLGGFRRLREAGVTAGRRLGCDKRKPKLQRGIPSGLGRCRASGRGGKQWEGDQGDGRPTRRRGVLGEKSQESGAAL